MKRMLLWTSSLLVIGYLAVCAFMFAVQRSLMYFPQPRSVSAPASTMRLPVEGAEIVVTVRPHEGDRAIIYFGGNAEDVSLNLADFSRAFPAHALYLMHYRGYGGSTGKPTEQALHADAEALFLKVHERHPDIAVIGRSLGSGVAVRLASRHPVSRLVLVSPYDSLREIAARAYPFLPVGLLMKDRYESGRHAPGITAPTAIIAAERDEVVPRASTEKLRGRFADGIATMTTNRGAGHNDLDAYPEYLATLRAAVR